MTKTTTKPFRLSASKMDAWMKCPLAARFQYLDRLPRQTNSAATFGTCIHHAMKIYNDTGDVELAVAEFVDSWENPEKLDAVPDVWTKRQTFGGMREKGVNIIREYHDHLRWENREVVATEHEFLVPFGEFELHGFIDLIEIRRNERGVEELKVVDYKTNATAPKISALPFNVQFTTYVYAALQPEFWLTIPKDVWERAHALPVRAYWYQLNGSKEIHTGVRDDDDFMRLYRLAKEIKNATEAGVFVPNLSGDSCGFCSFKEPCGLPVPKVDDD